MCIVYQNGQNPCLRIPQAFQQSLFLFSFSDICRVCRCEASSDRPLFHPCICTGSIKYIHQECLLQWLRYSKKEFCELCNHRFSFTPSEFIVEELPSSYVDIALVDLFRHFGPKLVPKVISGLIKVVGKGPNPNLFLSRPQSTLRNFKVVLKFHSVVHINSSKLFQSWPELEPVFYLAPSLLP